jgi:hypothetical protein
VNDFSIKSPQTKIHIICLLFSQCRADLFAASRTGLVLEKLLLLAALVLAGHQQCFAAALTAVLDKGHAAAVGARDVQRPAAAGTNGIPFFDISQTLGTIVTERTPAAAAVAEARVRLDQLLAVNAGLFVRCHIVAGLLKHSASVYLNHNKPLPKKNQ